MKHPGGRPSKYTQELVTSICNDISNGISLRKICLADDMPSIETVRVWLRDKPEFTAQYARAREEQADFYADVMNDLADDASLDKDSINKARLQIDTRKWIASKLKPKKYGDKLDLTTLGEKLPAPILGGATNVPRDDSSTQTPSA